MPVGPIAGGPDRPKVMVEQALARPLVSALVCGTTRILIYVAAAAPGRPLPQTFPEGRASITLLMEDGGDVVAWCESGVTMPASVSRAGGSGRELIERALPNRLGTPTTCGITRDGIRCTIASPICERHAAREDLDA